MTSKTPSSLKWLLDKRSRLSGSLEQCTSELASTETRHGELTKELARLQQLLRALDQTIGLHEIRVDPKLISDTRTKQPALFGHGKITKIVLQSLRREPGRWTTTGELVVSICTQAQVDQQSFDQVYLRRLIRRRLQSMCKCGLLERSGRAKNEEQRWRLRTSQFQGCGPCAPDIAEEARL